MGRTITVYHIVMLSDTKQKLYVDAGRTTDKFADFLCEILLAVTLEPFAQTELRLDICHTGPWILHGFFL